MSLFSPLQFEALDLLSASQVAQLTLSSGALNNADLIGLVFDRLEGGNAFQHVDEFLSALTRTPQVRSDRWGEKHVQVYFSVGQKNPRGVCDAILFIDLFTYVYIYMPVCLA